MLDGTSLAADNAIVIHGRSNVKIHDVTIVDFYANAIQFNGRVGTWGTPPETYSTGNELYNSTITNCNTRTASERGLSIGMIAMSGQDGLRIHHNTLTQTSRPMGENGDIVDGVEGHNRRLKFYSNTSVKPDTEGAEWNFHIEHWNSSGGMEVYDNNFLGGNAVDAAGNLTTRGTDEYSWWIHDNVMALRAQLPVFTDPIMCGVDFEGTVEDAIVNNNHFVNLANGVTFSLQYETTHQQNIRIYNNVFENIGYANGDFTAVVAGEVTGAMMVLQDIYIDNNTMVAAASAGKPGSGLLLNAIDGSIQRIFFRNNIVDGTGEYSYLSFWNGPGPVSEVHALNNLMFNVPSGIEPYTYAGANVSGFESANNLTGAPVFVSETDFSLQSSSPAIDHGMDVGLPFVGVAPDIGAFEYGAAP